MAATNQTIDCALIEDITSYNIYDHIAYWPEIKKSLHQMVHNLDSNLILLLLVDPYNTYTKTYLYCSSLTHT